MSRNIFYPTRSLEQFGYRCFAKRAGIIDVTFLAPVKRRTITEIDPFGVQTEESLLVVPLEIKCIGKAGESEVIYHKPPRSRHLVAYYHKPEVGNRLTAHFPINLEEITVKSERYARLIALRVKENAEAENQPYDFTINLFIDVFPYRRGQRILELKHPEISCLPSGDDYASILANQRHSNPCL